MQQPYRVPVLSPRQQKIIYALVLCWCGAAIWFWAWWLEPRHINNFYSPHGPTLIDWVSYVLNTFIIIWIQLLPGYYFYFLLKMRKPNPALEIPKEWRVAMVVTRAPDEPWWLIEKMLNAMLIQDVPHDTWLADEDPQPIAYKWCEEHGVKLITRKGVPGYFNKEWPRREKCKEGNLAYFFDTVGYENYDFVSQMDADHVPEQGYLRAMLRGFLDPKVGYVSAPSMNDQNYDETWISRGRIFMESTLHGTLQAGYHSGWAPMCIGSHYMTRTKALKEVGGLGPELAEDHSTSFMLTAGGWQGQHSIDALAHGEGPTSFADLMIQEFQWARSLAMIIIQVTPKLLHKLTFKQKFQFLFSQFWYFMYSAVMVMGYALAPVALVFNIGFANMTYLSFIGHEIVPVAFCVAIVKCLQKWGLLRPYYAKVVSWESALFQLARWPYICWAVYDSVKVVMKHQYLIWAVTPKEGVANSVAFRYIAPYFGVAGLCYLALFTHLSALWTHQMLGYFWLTALNAVSYTILIVSIYVWHKKENVFRKAHDAAHAVTATVPM
jgi:cellulose synthase (UDP-forming)